VESAKEPRLPCEEQLVTMPTVDQAVDSGGVKADLAWWNDLVRRRRERGA